MLPIRAMISLVILGFTANAPYAHAAPPEFLFCFSYGQAAQDGIRVSQVLSFEAPETRTDILARLAPRQPERDTNESGCSVSPSMAVATEARAAFIAEGGHARMRWLRGLSVKEVTVDTAGLEERDHMYLADAEAEEKGNARYVACYVYAGPGKHPVLLTEPFLSRQDGTLLIKDAMLNVPAYESYTNPHCESHVDKTMAAEFLKEGVALAATYGVPTATLKVNGQ